jgi:hypothetical protein
MSVVQYDPAKNLLNIAGRELKDWAEGSFIEITAGGPLSTVEKGPTGGVAITKKHETTAKLKVTLIKGSADCKFVGGLFAAWRAGLPMVNPVTPLGLTMQFKNVDSGSIATGTNLTPEEEPAMVGAGDNGSLAFTFIVCNYLPLHSGV